MTPDSAVYTLAEACALLGGIAPATYEKRARDGELPLVILSDPKRVSKAALDRLLACADWQPAARSQHTPPTQPERRLRVVPSGGSTERPVERLYQTRKRNGTR